MSSIQTLALILRTVDYGDNHVIVDLLGRHTGRVSAIAHGGRSSRKRFGGALEPLRVVEAFLSPRKSGELLRLDEMEVCQDFPGIDDTIDRITAASYATELVRETWREGEEAAPVFELLRRCYKYLSAQPDRPSVQWTVLQFEMQLLRLYGLAPAVDSCARCGATPESMDKLRFSRRAEGLICRSCRHDTDSVGVVTEATLAVLRQLAHPDLETDCDRDEQALAQARRVLSNAIDHLVERPLAARAMWRSLI